MFEFKLCRPAAIIALIIDVLVVLKVTSSLLQNGNGFSFVALLIEVYYSVNGTIVIFGPYLWKILQIHIDSESPGEIDIDKCIWQRQGTIYTVATSLFVIVSIFLFGERLYINFFFRYAGRFCQWCLYADFSGWSDVDVL